MHFDIIAIKHKNGEVKQHLKAIQTDANKNYFKLIF